MAGPNQAAHPLGSCSAGRRWVLHTSPVLHSISSILVNHSQDFPHCPSKAASPGAGVPEVFSGRQSWGGGSRAGNNTTKHHLPPPPAYTWTSGPAGPTAPVGQGGSPIGAGTNPTGAGANPPRPQAQQRLHNRTRSSARKRLLQAPAAHKWSQKQFQVEQKGWFTSKHSRIQDLLGKADVTYCTRSLERLEPCEPRQV